MSLTQGPYEVTAKVQNQVSHEEGTADAQLLPGTGVVWYLDANGDDRVRQAAANERTSRAAIAPGGAKTGTTFGADDPDQSPLDVAFDAGAHAYTLGYMRNDEARLRLSANATADPTDTLVGWDADGTITDSTGTDANGNPIPPEVLIARGLEVIDRGTADDFVRVAFL